MQSHSKRNTEKESNNSKIKNEIPARGCVPHLMLTTGRSAAAAAAAATASTSCVQTSFINVRTHCGMPHDGLAADAILRSQFKRVVVVVVLADRTARARAHSLHTFILACCFLYGLVSCWFIYLLKTDFWVFSFFFIFIPFRPIHLASSIVCVRCVVCAFFLSFSYIFLWYCLCVLVRLFLSLSPFRLVFIVILVS